MRKQHASCWRRIFARQVREFGIVVFIIEINGGIGYKFAPDAQHRSCIVGKNRVPYDRHSSNITPKIMAAIRRVFESIVVRREQQLAHTPSTAANHMADGGYRLFGDKVTANSAAMVHDHAANRMCRVARRQGVCDLKASRWSGDRYRRAMCRSVTPAFLSVGRCGSVIQRVERNRARRFWLGKARDRRVPSPHGGLRPRAQLRSRS